MALTEDSISIEDPRLAAADKLAIVLAPRGTGWLRAPSPGAPTRCASPLSHDVDSLNVAAASAVAFWQLRAR